jgi:hypothetical protein
MAQNQDPIDMFEAPKRQLRKFLDFMDKIPDPGKLFEGKKDTSWHDDMVRKATESFTKAAPKKEAMLGGKKAAAKKAAKKTVRKRS